MKFSFDAFGVPEIAKRGARLADPRLALRTGDAILRMMSTSRQVAWIQSKEYAVQASQRSLAERAEQLGQIATAAVEDVPVTASSTDVVDGHAVVPPEIIDLTVHDQSGRELVSASSAH